MLICQPYIFRNHIDIFFVFVVSKLSIIDALHQNEFWYLNILKWFWSWSMSCVFLTKGSFTKCTTNKDTLNVAAGADWLKWGVPKCQTTTSQINMGPKWYICPVCDSLISNVKVVCGFNWHLYLVKLKYKLEKVTRPH